MLSRLLKRTSPAVKRGPLSAVRHRDVAVERKPVDGGEETFETPEAHAINRARLEHLASLELPLAGRRVLDVGAGVGHLAQFFVERGCDVLAVEARAQNVEVMRRLYPTLRSALTDVEQDLTPLGRFDVVFCYGLLYHLENPIRALRNLASVCDDLLLIETMVCDSSVPVLRLEDEYLSDNQALGGIAHRPSPSYLATALDRLGVHYVYTAVEPPAHQDYRFEWKDNLETERDGQLLRGIFVGARHPIDSAHLVPLVDSGA
jgi:2-polyprenyl-3-methyl-5-hydroxy-6-metoxy-1,4-benzoquinol methylase